VTLSERGRDHLSLGGEERVPSPVAVSLGGRINPDLPDLSLPEEPAGSGGRVGILVISDDLGEGE
jgi:hypothetical protein